MRSSVHLAPTWPRTGEAAGSGSSVLRFCAEKACSGRSPDPTACLREGEMIPTHPLESGLARRRGLLSARTTRRSACKIRRSSSDGASSSGRHSITAAS
eukprot:scaffold287725_cov28-Tisochrysis_lutea.AAC.1